MSAYRFETITAGQALAVGGADTISFSVGPARLYMAYYGLSSAGEVTSLTVADAFRSVAFGVNLAALSTSGGLTFQDSSVLLIGASANDSFRGGSGDDALFGGPGNDSLLGGDGADLLQGNMGRDSIEGGLGADTIYGGQGDDVINAVSDGSPDVGNFVQGNIGNDRINGGSGADTLLGGQDADTISGGTGADYIDGNLGNDAVFGSGTLLGEAGNDTIGGWTQGDSISGGDGNDQISTAGGNVDGGGGADSITIGSGNSTVLGGVGDDTIAAPYLSRDYSTVVSGDAGNDSILGGRGADTISGGLGSDTIDGGGGYLDGDRISGGPGIDFFRISVTTYDATSGAPLGLATITDWEAGERIHFNYVGLPPGASDNYGETSAADYMSAFNAAKSLQATHPYNYVAVEVGSDVIVFASANLIQGPGAAVVLAGCSLAQIDDHVFV